VIDAREWVPDRTVEPQRRLAAALLTDAIGCYQTHAGAEDPVSRRLFAEAEAWIRSTDSRHVCSFESVCEILDLDPAFVRRGLRKWRDRALGPAR
jgi:hypothetical protein